MKTLIIYLYANSAACNLITTKFVLSSRDMSYMGPRLPLQFKYLLPSFVLSSFYSLFVIQISFAFVMNCCAVHSA